jgi:hypothetical protein
MIAPNVNILLNDIAKLKEGSPLVSQLDEEISEKHKNSEECLYERTVQKICRRILFKSRKKHQKEVSH